MALQINSTEDGFAVPSIPASRKRKTLRKGWLLDATVVKHVRSVVIYQIVVAHKWKLAFPFAMFIWSKKEMNWSKGNNDDGTQSVYTLFALWGCFKWMQAIQIANWKRWKTSRIPCVYTLEVREKFMWKCCMFILQHSLTYVVPLVYRKSVDFCKSQVLHFLLLQQSANHVLSKRFYAFYIFFVQK